MGPKSIKHLNMCLAVDASLTAAQLPGKQGALGCCTEQNTAQGLFAGSPPLKLHAFTSLRRPPTTETVVVVQSAEIK